MKETALAVFLSLAATALGQEWDGVSLGKPLFVAKGVKNVFWARDGRCLAYTTETKDGLAVGVFDLDTGEGKVVQKLTEDESVDSLDWLNAGKKAVLVLKGKKENPQLSVTVLDAHELTSRQVWNRRFAVGDDPSMDVDVSPLLAHALLTLQAGKASETWVLTAGANSVVFSRDIAMAQSQGQTFADWSSSGTALFTAVAGQDLSGKVDVTLAQGDGDKGAIKLVFQTQADDKADGRQRGVAVLGEIPILSRFFVRMRPAIPAGATVLECVPSNGALRPVRFPGYFEPKPDGTVPPDLHAKLSKLTLGQSVAGSQALWLVPQQPQVENADGNRPPPLAEPKAGVLVSAQADAWWPAPSLRAIAFAWNGAVFVRTVKTAQK